MPNSETMTEDINIIFITFSKLFLVLIILGIMMLIEIVKIVNTNIIIPLGKFSTLINDIRLLPKKIKIGMSRGFLALKFFFFIKNINIQAIKAKSEKI